MLPTGRNSRFEVTPAMVDAGVKVLRESGVLSDGKQRSSDLAATSSEDPAFSTVLEILEAAIAMIV